MLWKGVRVLWIDCDDEIYSSFAVSTWWTSRSDGGSDLPWMSELSYPQWHANFLQHKTWGLLVTYGRQDWLSLYEDGIWICEQYVLWKCAWISLYRSLNLFTCKMTDVAARIKLRWRNPPNHFGTKGYLRLQNAGQIIVLVCKYFNGTSLPEIDGQSRKATHFSHKCKASIPIPVIQFGLIYHYAL